MPKHINDEVTGGSINIDSPLTIRVTRVGEQTRLAAIRRLMDQAATEKPKLVGMADRVAARFVSALLVLAIATALVWYFIDPSRMLWVFVSVLVVSCPCALSLATPTAMTVAAGALSRRGLLIARGHATETLGKVTHIMFDKTGTLTHGQLHLTEVWPCRDMQSKTLCAMAAALEHGSAHPIARALTQTATSTLPAVEQLRTYTGGGVEATIDNIVDARLVRLGSPNFASALHEQSHALPPSVLEWQANGATIVAMADAEGWLGFFCLTDAVREDAAKMVAQLHNLGLRLGVVSGDSTQAAQLVANAIGIGFEQVAGGLSPQAKRERIQALQAQGAIVAMIGDGVNDAPVLAQAQISIAMGSGADLSRTQADVVLLGEQLMPLADGVKLARRTLVIVKQNLVWAFAYNLTAIPLAMTGLVTPWMAGIGMSASSLGVTLNALRLARADARVEVR